MNIDFNKLDRAFNPRCIAVVGDRGKLVWLHNQSTFKGKLYSVQVSPESIKAIEALGVKNYKSILDIPDQVDLVIVCVSRGLVPKILEDCIAKGVTAVHLFSAGFSETGTEEGRELEKGLVERAKQADLYLIGPNCVGIYNPSLGMRQGEEQYTGFAGAVGFISQSGTHARSFAFQSYHEGVYINKSVSFGNGTVLDASTYLEYFGQDKGIEVIGMYLEGVRDGKKFLAVLREVSAKKPVVIWKGGRTREAVRAIHSHTSSLAIQQEIWKAVLKQGRAISVSNLQELIDTVKALVYLPPVRHRGVGITGGSGGESVAITDALTEEGLEVPSLTPESYEVLQSFFNLIGASYRNPIDTGKANSRESKRILEILEQDTNIGNLALLVPAKPGWRWDTLQELDEDIRCIIDVRRRTLKPMIAVIPFSTPEEMKQARDIATRLQEGRVPVFYTYEGAARALVHALEYHNASR